QLVLGLEFILRWNRVGRDAENLRAGLAESAPEAGEVDRLLGAAGGVCPRIEIQYELAPGKIGERNGAAAIAGEDERRRDRAGAKLAGHMPSFRRFPRGNLARQHTRAGGWGRSLPADFGTTGWCGELKFRRRRCPHAQRSF